MTQPAQPVVKGSNASKKHSHAKVSPLTDTILTSCFFGLVIYACYLFYNSSPDHFDLIYFFLFCALVMIAVKTVEFFCQYVIRDIISTRILTSGSHKDPLSNEASYAKFVGTMWQFSIHFTMTVCEGYLLWNESWLSNTHTAFMPPLYTPTTILRLFYILQTAIWTMTCFSHRFNSDAHAHKDYVLMYIHHLFTIALVAVSFHNGQTRIGLCVLFIHDCSDIGIDLLKLSNYLVLEGPNDCFITELSYTFAIVMWGYFRLWYFPIYIIYKGSAWVGNFTNELSIHNDIPTILQLTGADYDRLWWTSWACSALLTGLFLMHVWWFVLLLRILFRMLKGDDHRQIGSDEYNGDFNQKGTTGKKID